MVFQLTKSQVWFKSPGLGKAPKYGCSQANEAMASRTYSAESPKTRFVVFRGITYSSALNVPAFPKAACYYATDVDMLQASLINRVFKSSCSLCLVSISLGSLIR